MEWNEADDWFDCNEYWKLFDSNIMKNASAEPNSAQDILYPSFPFGFVFLRRNRKTLFLSINNVLLLGTVCDQVFIYSCFVSSYKSFWDLKTSEIL